MARASREHPPTGSGPGRGTPRSRTTARPAQRAAERSQRPAVSRTAPTTTPDADGQAERPAPFARGLGLTRRALVFLVVAAVLLLSYASSLRVYFRQQSQIAAAQASIADRQQSIGDLQQQVARWQDPNYVKAQARNRLGWVMPGEIGYQVIGADGKVLSPTVSIDGSSQLPAGEHATTWYERLVGSIATADDPAPAASTKPTTIGPSTTPSPSASGSASGRASAKPKPSATGSGR